MTDLKLAFGLRDIPESVTTAWGARLIWPNDLVHDRQDLVGPNAERLKWWLNTYEGGKPLRLALERMRHPSGIGPTDDHTFTLYEDDYGCIVGNPQGSHGYLYVAAWLWADQYGVHEAAHGRYPEGM
jgi:hypothetical protein